jgi:hypothetical protein
MKIENDVFKLRDYRKFLSTVYAVESHMGCEK